MPESRCAVINTKTANRPSTTVRASRFCAALGGNVERMKCCSSGTAASVFSIAATLRCADKAGRKRYGDCALRHQQECGTAQTYLPENYSVLRMRSIRIW